MDVVEAIKDTLFYFGLWRGLLAVLTLGLAYLLGWSWMLWWRVWVAEHYRRRLAD